MLKVLLSFLMMGTAALQAMGTADTRVPVTLLEEPAEGIVYAVYENAEDEEPLAERLIVDKQGFLTIPSAYKSCFLQQETTISGAYFTKDKIPVEELTEIELDPIDVVLQPHYGEESLEGTFILKDGEKEKEVKGNEEIAIGHLLEAGRKYQLIEKEQQKYMPIDVEIEVAEFAPKEQVVYVLEHEKKARIVFEGPKETLVHLYEDEKGEKPLLDGEEPLTAKIGEEIWLQGGKYSYRAEYPDTYYEDEEVHVIDVDHEKEEQIILRPKPLQMHVFMEGSENYQIILQDGEKEMAKYSNDGKEHVFTVQRDHTYTIKTAAQAGFYDLEPVSVHVDPKGSCPKVHLQPSAFTVFARIMEEGHAYRGTVIVRDTQGRILQRIPCTEEGVMITGLVQGETYVMSALSIDQYACSDSLTMTITRESKYDIRFPVISFAELTLQNENGSVYGLYQDARCKFAARDQKGHDLVRIKGGRYRLRVGTYYLKQLEKGTKQYPWLGVEKITVSRHGTTVDLPYEPCLVTLGASIKGSEDHLQMDLLVRDNGRIIERFTGKKICALEPGRSYTLAQASDLKGFIPVQPLSFTVPMTKQESAYQLVVEPYHTLHVEVPVETRLYMDERGEQPVYDIYDRQVIFAGERKDADLREGEYYLYIPSQGKGYYGGGMRKIGVHQAYVPYVEDLQKVRLAVELKDHRGAYVEGALLALLDETGTEQERWVSTSSAHELQCELEAGKAYKLKQLKAPMGHKKMETDIVYTMPATAPDEIPVLTIHTEQFTEKKVNKSAPQHESVHEEEKHVVMWSWLLGISGIAAAVLCWKK